METNNLTIIPPEGMEVYQDGNEIKFRPIKKKLTYRDVTKELFKTGYHYISNDGSIESINGLSVGLNDKNNCTSFSQAQKLLAINMLMNVAKYLNGSWKPNWLNPKEPKYYIYLEGGNCIRISSCAHDNSYMTVFKSISFAQQAIDILGEDSIKLALSTDW